MPDKGKVIRTRSHSYATILIAAYLEYLSRLTYSQNKQGKGYFNFDHSKNSVDFYSFSLFHIKFAWNNNEGTYYEI